MRAIAFHAFPRRAPGKLAMRWRVLGAFIINAALWAGIIWGVRQWLF